MALSGKRQCELLGARSSVRFLLAIPSDQAAGEHPCLDRGYTVAPAPAEPHGFVSIGCQDRVDRALHRAKQQSGPNCVIVAALTFSSAPLSTPRVAPTGSAQPGS